MRKTLPEGRMLVLNSDIKPVTTVAFSPDGLALAAANEQAVQAWPRWLDGDPRPAVRNQRDLERIAFSPDASRLFLYLSGNSRTRELDVAAGTDRASGVPSNGPAWLAFTTDGGFFIACHGRGKLSRFEFAPNTRRKVVTTWTIDRKTQGSHYRFGDISVAAGVFVALEYRFGGDEPLKAVVVRSVADGSVVHREKVTEADGQMLLEYGGLKFAIHPSGAYGAFPMRNRIRLWPLAKGGPRDAVGRAGRSHFRGVAFHPNGRLLAAATNDGTVKVFDTTTWQAAREFAWNAGRPQCVAFTPDGTRAACGTDAGKVVVWDLDV